MFYEYQLRSAPHAFARVRRFAPELVIRMFARTRHFESYWAGARNEFHADFAAHVDDQLEYVRSERKYEAVADDASGRTPVEIQIALDVQNEPGYTEYRTGIAPILARHGGRLIHDFRVAQAVLSEAGVQVNRVSTVRFPDESAKEAFFGDPEYEIMKKKHFDHAVRSSVLIAAYALSWPRSGESG